MRSISNEGYDWQESLKDIKCNQIILILKEDMPIEEAEQFGKALCLIKRVLTAIPNRLERTRDGD